MTERNATTELSSFHQSRLYAEGWKAARRSLEPEANPYTKEPERARWLKGYTEGSV